MKKKMFGFIGIAAMLDDVGAKMVRSLHGKQVFPRKKTLLTKSHTSRHTSDKENLEYDVEVKVQVTITPIYTSPKRDANECANYVGDTDICSVIGGKCKGRCLVDCLYFESKQK